MKWKGTSDLMNTLVDVYRESEMSNHARINEPIP